MTPEQTAKAIVAEMKQEYPGSLQLACASIPGWLERRITSAIQAASNEQLERCRAHDRQANVAAFHRKFGVPCPERPGWPSQERIDLRVKLIAEEFCEFLRDAGYECILQIERPTFDEEGEPSGGLIVVEREEDDEDPHYGMIDQQTYESEERNLPKAADALIDMEYVILGTHCEFGIDSNPLWAEVQRANMAKEGGAVRSDGKILKPAGWVGPDIEGALRKQGWHGMTRKKAIEAAMKRLSDGADECRLYGVRTKHRDPIDIEAELEAMHMQGRLAGLREAARMAADYKNRRAMQPDQFAAAEVIEGMVSDHARALAWRCWRRLRPRRGI